MKQENEMTLREEIGALDGTLMDIHNELKKISTFQEQQLMVHVKMLENSINTMNLLTELIGIKRPENYPLSGKATKVRR